MKPAALYHRVSTLDQDPDLARGDLRRAAEARGFSVAHEVNETGSGANNDRPGLAAVMALARRAEVAAVLVWKLDRWGRSAMDVLTNIRALETYGCEFHAVTQGLSIAPDGGPMSRLILTVLAGVAEFERELIRERTRLGQEKARARGRRIGRPPSLDAVAAQGAREMRQAGYSWSQIASSLGVKVSAVRRVCA